MKIQKLIMLSLAIGATACGTQKETTVTPEIVQAMPAVTPTSAKSPTASALPKAVIYKMEGNATIANVPVQVSPSNGSIVSFPAPADVRGQEPIELTGGYLLDRRGIGPNTRFTRWTYSEYGSLDRVPTSGELKAAIIPGARVTDIHVLDMTPAEAAADTAAINRIIRQF